VGNQETFYADTDDPAVVRSEILRVATSVARRLRKAGLMGRVVTLGVRFADFKAISGSLTLPSPIDTAHELYAAALTLYDQPRMRTKPIRRVGIRMAGLVPAAEAHLQPALGEPETGWREAEQATDTINNRFGRNSVQRAVLTRLAARNHPIPPGRAALSSPFE
jgi:DNA polymerase-4